MKAKLTSSREHKNLLSLGMHQDEHIDAEPCSAPSRLNVVYMSAVNL